MILPQMIILFPGDQPRLSDPYERKTIYIADGIMQVKS